MPSAGPPSATLSLSALAELGESIEKLPKSKTWELRRFIATHSLKFKDAVASTPMPAPLNHVQLIDRGVHALRAAVDSARVSQQQMPDANEVDQILNFGNHLTSLLNAANVVVAIGNDLKDAGVKVSLDKIAEQLENATRRDMLRIMKEMAEYETHTQSMVKFRINKTGRPAEALIALDARAKASPHADDVTRSCASAATRYLSQGKAAFDSEAKLTTSVLAEAHTVPLVTTFGYLFTEPGPRNAGAWTTATRLDLDLSVAVKSLHARAKPSLNELVAAVQHAEAWVKVSHPHLACVFGLAPLASPPFLVFRDALTEALVDYARLHPDAHLRLLYQVAQGLAHLHASSVVHGNLCPPQVLMDGHGNAVIFPTSIERALSVHPREPAYTAPELFGDSPVAATPAADVFAFGMLAFEIMGGTPPFVGDSATVIQQKLLSRERPTCPKDSATYLGSLWTIIERCWSPDAPSRPTMANVMLQLKVLYEASVTAARPTPAAVPVTAVPAAVPPATAAAPAAQQSQPAAQPNSQAQPQPQPAPSEQDVFFAGFEAPTSTGDKTIWERRLNLTGGRSDSLTLRSKILTPAGIRILARALTSARQRVNTLIFDSVRLDTAMFGQLADCLTPKLAMFVVENNTNLTIDVAAATAIAARLPQGLQDLTIHGVDFLPGAFAALVANLPAGLEELSLSHNNLADADIEVLAAKLPPNLKDLSLRKNRLTDAGLAALVPKLPRSLKKLRLCGNAQLTSASLTTLARIAAELHTLRTGEIPFGDAGMVNFDGPRSLRNLSLGRCGLSDVGARVLFRAIPDTCPRLETLDLAGNAITDQFIADVKQPNAAPREPENVAVTYVDEDDD
ncbi:hypothetical protein H9P43_004303 [Blastocladiella emersonii ATCC 22665]|nr:hypothetical protein H9P43_004303 [Blastocladiella emersonii ATCC 22665]